MHRQGGDDVRLLHGFVPLAFAHGRSVRLRWRAGLQLENIHRAVEPGRFVRTALPRRRMVRHKLPLLRKERMIYYCDCERHSNRLQRSEEHTSELQSHLNLVCRLLLEKKKVNKKTREMSQS